MNLWDYILATDVFFNPLFSKMGTRKKSHSEKIDSGYTRYVGERSSQVLSLSRSDGPPSDRMSSRFDAGASARGVNSFSRVILCD